MNKDDIKKALEFCADAFPCEGCAYHDDLMCTDKLKTDALNVIIEQEQEIEEWKNDYAKLQEQFAQYQMASDKEIIAQRKQAKIDVLNELKKKNPGKKFYPLSEKGICQDMKTITLTKILNVLFLILLNI